MEINYMDNMKKTIFLLLCLLPFGLSAQNYWFNKPTTTTLNTADELLLYQSGLTKNFTIGTLGNMVNDSSNVLRTEWTSEIGDSTAVLRLLIDAGGTVDTAFLRITNIVYLRVEGDSVGIGTSDPSEKLEVSGNVKAAAAIFDDGYDNVIIGNTSGISLISSGADNTFIGDAVGGSTTSGDYNVFIGSLAGSDNTTEGTNTYIGALAGMNATGNSNTFVGGQAGEDVTSLDNVLLGYQTGRYNSSENTVIGTQAQNSASGTVSGTVVLGFQAGQNNTTSNVLIIDNSNTATPLIWGDFNADSIIINGDFRVTGYSGGANAWTNESDSTLKKNIETIHNPLQKVMNLRGVSFNWKDGRESKKRIGFLAQEVQGIVPEVVDGQEGSMGIQYAPVVALLTEAMQAQQVLIVMLFFIVIILGVMITLLFFKVRNLKYVKYK